MALACRRLPFLLAGLCAGGQAKAQLPDGAALPQLELLATIIEDSNVGSSQNLRRARYRGSGRDLQSCCEGESDRSYGPGNIYLKGLLGYDFYQTNSILDREHIDLSSGADRQFGKCEVAGSGTFSRMQSGLEDLTGPIVNNTQTNSSASLTTQCDQSDRIWALLLCLGLGPTTVPPP